MKTAGSNGHFSGEPTRGIESVPDFEARQQQIDRMRSALERMHKSLRTRAFQTLEAEIVALHSFTDAFPNLGIEAFASSAIAAIRMADPARLRVLIAELERELVERRVQIALRSKSPDQLAGARILLVDPENTLSDSLGSALEAAGFRISLVSNTSGAPCGAHQTPPRHTPDAVIVAPSQARFDAIEFIKRFTASPFCAHTPVLALTEDETPDQIQTLFAAGASDWARLPLCVQTVRRRTERLLLQTHAQSTLTRVQRTDDVTGLGNREYFKALLKTRLAAENHAQGASFAVLFLELDRFDALTGGLGHEARDTLLRAIGQRIALPLGAGDGLARLGSEEFAVLAPLARTAAEAAQIADRILDSVQRPIACGGFEIDPRARVGITLCPPMDATLTECLRQADTALLHAKRHGLAYAFFDPGMHERAQTQLNLRSDLRQALERNQFELHYQPQVCLRTARCMSAEALLRWRHPERGLLGPGDFLPLLEESGQIREVGTWVVEQAVTFARQLTEGGLNTSIERIAVNLSPRQFDAPGLGREIADILCKRNVSGSALEVELTENTVLLRPEAVRGTLHTLKSLGVSVAIDDFGAGYSTFGYLKRFPVDTLKIDRSLISDIVTHSDDKAIVGAIIALAEALGLGTVAEGVENLGELALLKQMGCAAVQGFYLSKPLTQSAFIEAYCTPVTPTVLMRPSVTKHVASKDIGPNQMAPRNFDPRNIDPRNIDPRNRNIDTGNIDPADVAPEVRVSAGLARYGCSASAPPRGDQPRQQAQVAQLALQASALS